MLRPNVYEYLEPKEYLMAVLSFLKTKNPSYSLRAWGRQLGYKTPSYVSEVIVGKKGIGLDLAKRVGKNQNLKNDEQRYLELIVMASNAKSTDEKQFYFDVLKNLRPDFDIFNIEQEQFRLIADWYHTVIIEMADLPYFREDYKWIATRLGNEITPPMVQTAVERLLRLKILIRDNNNKLKKSKYRIKVGDKGADEAIRIHHQQMLHKASEAIEQQSIDERYIAGSNIPISKADLPKAFKMMKEFHDALHKELATNKPDYVYRFNTQIFKLISEQGG